MQDYYLSCFGLGQRGVSHVAAVVSDHDGDDGDAAARTFFGCIHLEQQHRHHRNVILFQRVRCALIAIQTGSL